MNTNEKLFELLEKENLSEDEKHLLDSLLKDQENKKLFDAYSAARTVTKSTAHLSTEEIADFVLIKNNIEPENKNILKKVPFVEEHLRSCSKCEEEFKLINIEYSEVDNYISAGIEQNKTQTQKTYINVMPPFVKKGFISRYAFASLIVVLFSAVIIYLLNDFLRPNYYRYASINESDGGVITRGRATDEFQESLKAIEEENYTTAISKLNDDIKNNPEDETIFYTHYVLGLTYLETAETSFLGLFTSFDKEKAAAGLEHLKKTIELNNSGKFNNVNFDAYFYSAKALLMLGKLGEAKKYLSLVIENKGGKMEEAKNILNGLD